MDKRYRKPNKQKKLIAFITNHKNWHPPTYAEIAKHMGWKSRNSVFKALKSLIK